MNPISRAVGFYVAGTFAAIFLAGWLSQCAFGQTTGEPGAHVGGHARYHDAYREWRQPGGVLSCCNARIVMPGGMMIGDCYPTEFRLTVKGWRARLAPEDGAGEGDGWVSVPDGRLIREKNPDPSGTTGHLCYAHGVVLCAVPPAGTL